MISRKYATPFGMLHSVSLLSHKSRLQKFAKAIKLGVQPESYVVDLGSGTGVLAMLAAKAGAKRVTAVEINPETAEYGRKAVEANGFSDRIEFVCGHFLDFIPEEKADIVICEMLSSMLLVEQQNEACSHAVRNILRPGGLIMPGRVSVYIVPVECRHLWKRFVFDELKFPFVPQTANHNEAKDMADASILAEFNFSESQDNPSVNRKLPFEITEKGVVHGCLGFFEAQLYGDICLQMIDGWRELFLPLIKPLTVSVGDKITVSIRYIPGRYDTWSLQAELDT